MNKTILSTLALMMIAPGAMAEITVKGQPYAFQTAPQQKNGAAFLTLKNSGDADVLVTAASSDVADDHELHTMSMDTGLMEMREVESFTVPAGGKLKLKPTGNHAMFMGLKEPLALDSTFPLTLTLDNGETVTADVKVVKPGTKPKGYKGHKHQHGHKP